MENQNSNPNTNPSGHPKETGPSTTPGQSYNNTTPPTNNAKKSLSGGLKSSWRNSLAIVGILAAALLLAWCLVAFVFQQYQVEGPSMESTLQNNNRLIVLKVQRTWSRITGNPYIPERGNIIIFNEKNLYGVDTGTTTQLIKRVIGLPGDHIVIKNGSITIYNKQHPNGFDPDRTMPYGTDIGQTSGDINMVVPKDEVFVCGDNRGNSYDSRDFGPVPVSQIIGKLALRVTPVNEVKFF